MHLSWADGRTDRSSGRCQGICDGDNVDTEVCSLSNASLLVKISTFCGFSGWRSGWRYLLPWSPTICKNTVWRFLSGMRPASVMFKASWHILSRFAEYWFRLPMLDALHGWNTPWSEKLSRSLHPGRASLSRELNLLTRETLRHSKEGAWVGHSWRALWDGDEEWHLLSDDDWVEPWEHAVEEGSLS